MKFSDGFGELGDSIKMYAAGADDDAADDLSSQFMTTKKTRKRSK